MKKLAVIVAGGLGSRMQASQPKQFMQLHGQPILWHTLQAFLSAYADLQIILVLPADYFAIGQEIVHNTGQAGRIAITAGGDSRYQSVKNGLALVKEPAVIFVHDAVRCLVTTALIQHCYLEALKKGNAVPAISPVDSIRLVAGAGNQVLDRQMVRIIQTPQTFLSSQLLPAFEQPFHEKFTDEATVVEHTGIAIHLVEGDKTNIKITHPTDLLVAANILAERTARQS
ncbi:MAG TPA: 2-C-methyl-D-erythritol 4-phosphate cytidylyltransferase [Chitinophagaceae bacterium]|nr:2-C-methyl-D-erythritol 4-phosphate cytidylyltransferase [Chitinophagaceae bacterium]